MYTDLPPPHLMAGADSLQALLLRASTEARAFFFAEIGLEASPDEVSLWGTPDFAEIIVEFGKPGHGNGMDSITVLHNGLPLHLLQTGDLADPESSSLLPR